MTENKIKNRMAYRPAKFLLIVLIIFLAVIRFAF